MSALNLLVIAGSERKGALSRTLARDVAQRARDADVKAVEFDLRALNLPIYDGDIENDSGVPEGAYSFYEALIKSSGVLLVTPEYNGFPTPLVINAFDWLSRIGLAAKSKPTEFSGASVTTNKPIALLSTSPGAAGGLRCINFLRLYLQMNFQMLVVPKQFSLGKANEAFDEQGRLKDPKNVEAVEGVLQAWIKLAGKLQ